MATNSNPDRNLVIALGGGLKMEVIFATACTDGDTLTSKLASPTAAFMVPAADAGATTTNPSITISSKTLTLNDPATTAMTIVVFGT